MHDQSLAALHVLVTRPAPQQEKLVAAIEAAGGTALHLPLLAIKPLTDETNNSTLIDTIQNLDRYHCLIFVSANAVQHGVQWIDRYWPQFPVGIELVAVGPATARELEQALNLPVSHADTGVTSEDLLAMPQFADIAGRRIGIVRGRGGRELLAETLRARGAVVDYLEVYERKFVGYSQGQFAAQLREHDINVLTVSSAESLQHLSAVLGDNKAEMSLLPLLVPSPRVAAEARTAGFEQVINTGGADVAALLQALQTLAGPAPD